MRRYVYAQRRNMAKLFIFWFCISLLMAMQVNAQDLLIIANNGVPESTLSSSDIESIFLGNKTTWQNGDKIVFAIWEDPDVQTAFLKQYLKKSPAQYKNYWKSQVFTGKGSIPPSFKTENEIFTFVETTRGAIAFVSAPGGASVKILTVE